MFNDSKAAKLIIGDLYLTGSTNNHYVFGNADAVEICGSIDTTTATGDLSNLFSNNSNFIIPKYY